jgi:hypothetical protein
MIGWQIRLEKTQYTWMVFGGSFECVIHFLGMWVPSWYFNPLHWLYQQNARNVWMIFGEYFVVYEQFVDVWVATREDIT